MSLTYRSVKGSALTSGEADANILYLDDNKQNKILTGYVAGTAAVIVATDSVLEAFGKIQAQIIDGALTSVTHAQITTAISGSTLTPGTPYKITDFKTVHQVPNDTVLNTAIASISTESIIVIASSTNTLEPIAFSPSNPNDVIYYDVTNVLCEDSITARKGKIIRRIDTLKNLDTPYDFRACYFLRMGVDPGTNPVYTNLTVYAEDAGVWVSGDGFYKALRAHTGAASFATTDWVKMINVSNATKWLYTSSQSIGGITINALSSSKEYFKTFNVSECKNIIIHPTSDGTYNNIVIHSTGSTTTDVIFEAGCRNITVDGYGFSNVAFKAGTNNLIVDRSTANGTFGPNVYNSTYGTIINFSFGPLCNGNVIGSSNSIHFKGEVGTTKVGSAGHWITMGVDLGGNTIGNSCSDITMDDNVYNNKNGNSCSFNYYGYACYANLLVSSSSIRFVGNSRDNQITNGSSLLFIKSSYNELKTSAKTYATCSFYGVNKKRFSESLSGVTIMESLTTAQAAGSVVDYTVAVPDNTLSTLRSPNGNLWATTVDNSGVLSLYDLLAGTSVAAGSGLLPLAGGTMSGDILFTVGKGIDTTSAGASDTLNIGATNADIINIGRTGAVVNILGTTLYENVTNLQVTDKLITLNKGGAAASGGGTGFEIEENAIITGYIKTSSGRSGFDIKAPSISGIATISLSGITGSHTYNLPDLGGTLALLSDVTGSYLPLVGGNLTGILSVTTAGFYQEVGAGYLLIENTGATKGIIEFADTGGSNFTLDISFNTLTANRVINFPNIDGTLSTLAGSETFTQKVSYNGLVITADTGVITTGTWSATTIAPNKGGTGITSYAIGDLLYADTTSSLAKLADVSAGSYLRSGGVTTAPLWSTLKLPNAATAGRVMYATATDTVGSSGELTFSLTTGLSLISSSSGGLKLDITSGTSTIDFLAASSRSGLFAVDSLAAYFACYGTRDFLVYTGGASFNQRFIVKTGGTVGIGLNLTPAAMLDILSLASTVGLKIQKNATGTDDLIALYNSAPTKITYFDYLGRLFVTDTTTSTTTGTGSIVNSGGFGNAGSATIGGVLKVTNSTSAGSAAGAVVVTGGVNAASLYITGVSQFANRVNLINNNGYLSSTGSAHSLSFYDEFIMIKSTSADSADPIATVYYNQFSITQLNAKVYTSAMTMVPVLSTISFAGAVTNTAPAVANFQASLDLQNATNSVDNYYGYLVKSITGSGVVNTSAYGLYVESISKGTNRYAIYTNTGVVRIGDDLKLETAGKGIYIKEGSNATMGTATLSAGSVVVSTTKVTANSRIFLEVNGGTLTNVGAVYVSARTAGTSFTITSLNILDTSDVAWVIIEPS